MEARDYARALEPCLASGAGYARSLLKNRQDAEDAVQLAALKGLERISSFDDRRLFKAWWFAILRNCCFDHMRRARTARTEPLGARDFPSDFGQEERPNWTGLDAAIASLSPRHGEILRLRYFGDLSYAELAAVLKIPPGTVMSRLHLARKALAVLLMEHDE